MITPSKCKNCTHCKISNSSDDVKPLHDSEQQEVEYCDYIEYFNEYGVPVPYPYFFKEEYPCKGYNNKEVQYNE